MNDAIQELENRAKITPDMFDVAVFDHGKLVTITRKLDSAVHEYRRATEWPRATEFMNNLSGAQLNDVFPVERKKKKK